MQPLLQPAEVVVLAISLELVGSGGDVETINDPRVVAQKLKEPYPGLVGLQGQGFFVGLEVDEPPPPREIGEGAPFGGNEWRVVAVLPRPDDAGMFIQGECDLRLVGQPCAFQNNLGT